MTRTRFAAIISLVTSEAFAHRASNGYSPVRVGAITARNQDAPVLAVGIKARPDHDAAVAVVYHGSITEKHGLYWATQAKGRFALYQEWDSLRPSLTHVREESITLLTAAR